MIIVVDAVLLENPYSHCMFCVEQNSDTDFLCLHRIEKTLSIQQSRYEHQQILATITPQHYWFTTLGYESP